MTFQLEKFFIDVFAPQKGDVLTIMYDVPRPGVPDLAAWQERRAMAEDWQGQISKFAGKYDLQVNPVVTYDATGRGARDLPEYGQRAGKQIRLDDVARDSTILISMPQFSATAPLSLLARKYENLRVASMPTVAKAMEETGLSADYQQVAQTCAMLAPLFDAADGIQVVFSTGQSCYFDKSDHKPARQDTGLLHPAGSKGSARMSNLPAGEVFVVPNEAAGSKTHGVIPVKVGTESMEYVVDGNRIVDVRGDGPLAAAKRQEFRDEKALSNIAEVAIGCNTRAAVTGNVLEDEKAGFHWAYGRSEHLGGSVGPQDFSGPEKVFHHDTVYARGNPIVCQQLDFILPDGTRKTAIINGVLTIGG